MFHWCCHTAASDVLFQSHVHWLIDILVHCSNCAVRFNLFYISLHVAAMVVVGAQPAAPSVVVTQQARAPDYLTLTLVGFFLCFCFGGLIGMLLLVPALICSVMVS